jgi:2'-5' RNA ligase
MQGVFDFCRDLSVRPKQPERLFLALLSNKETARAAGEVRERFVGANRLKGTSLPGERLHISVHHVKDDKRLRTKFVYAARQAGRAVSLSPFEVTFRFITSLEGGPPRPGRPKRWPLVLLAEGEGLPELHKVLGVALRRYGLKAEEHFTPHMTLFYGDKPIATQPIEPIRFMVDEFVLIHSELWLTRYNILDRWRLAG